MGFDFGSFLGAIVGGIVTLIGVYLTINYYKKSDNKKLQMQIFSERPDLKIDDIKNKKVPDVEMIIVPIEGVKFYTDQWVYLKYDNEFTKDKSEFNYIDYYFQNAGKTAISCISFFSSNKKFNALFEMYDINIKRKIQDGDPNFEVLLDKRVDPGDVIKVRMYHGDKVYGNVISAQIVIVLIDTSNRIYSQPFFYPQHKVYSSRLYEGGYRKYQQEVKLDDYMEYMINKLKRENIKV